MDLQKRSSVKMYFRKVSSVSYFEQKTVVFSFVKMAGERKIQNDIADLYANGFHNRKEIE